MASAFDRSAILESFLKELHTYLPEIEMNLERVQRQGTDADALEEMYRRVHTIGGSAAMMDLHGIAGIANGMENTLGDALDGIAPLNDTSIALLRRSVARLRQLMDLARTGADDSSIVKQDRADYAALRGNAPAGGLPRAMGGPGAGPGASQPMPTPPSQPMTNPAPPYTPMQPMNGRPPMPNGTSPNGAPPPRSPYGPATTPVQQNGMPPGQPMQGQVVRLNDTALWQDVLAEQDAVQQSAGVLVQSIASLRDVARRFDGERSELMKFLDGSQDALERLEQWAGQAMGIDLRTSPDHVRRYLPLSVLWVVTARIKHVTDLLNEATRGLTVRQEALDDAIGLLRQSVANAGQLAGGAVSAAAQSPNGSFSATVGQFTYTPPARRATTGDLSPGARVEAERAVREDLRRELEDDVRAEIAGEVRRDEERRLRNELKIEVRRELLAELSPSLGAGAMLPSGFDFSGESSHTATQAPRRVEMDATQNDEALEVFRAEAEEHLRTIADGLNILERTPGDTEAIRSVRRAMHTLKGAAAITGFTVVAELAHLCEDLLDRISDGSLTATPEILSLVFDTGQGLEALITGDTGEQGGKAGIVAALRPRYQMILGETVTLLPAVTPTHIAAASGTMPRQAVRIADEDENEAPGEVRVERSDADLNVRLPLRKLDELLTLFGDIIVNRSVVEERMGRLTHMVADNALVSERLREVGQQIETEFEAAFLPSQRNSPLPGGPQAAHRPPMNRAAPNFGGVVSGPNAIPGPDFDPLEMDSYSEFHRLSRGLTESIADAGTLSTEMESTIREMEVGLLRESRLSSLFQDSLLKARLVPLSSLIPRLYRAIRAVALKYGKEFDLLIEGDDTEIDRGVYEDISAPLLHVVRNAIYHGIETPDERLSAGKPPKGQIVLSARYEGNQLIVAVRDDGRGINPTIIRAAAQARGLIDAYTQLNDHDVINLIFQPGFSTAEVITEEGGRGVGLDVVRDTVLRLRGNVEVESVPGQGSRFVLSVPISLQIQRVVLVRTGDQVYAIPMNVVEQIVQLDYYGRSMTSSTPAIEVRGERYPLVHLASYLNLSASPVNDKTPVLLINSGTRRWGLLIDAVSGRQEIVSKGLGPHLRNVPSISGATVLGNGQVVLILDPMEMLTRTPRSDALVPTIPPPGTVLPGQTNSRIATLGEQRVSLRPTPVPASAPRPASSTPGGPPRVLPYILVVDDSPSVRRVVSTTLKNAGWDVMTARDGQEALEVVAQRIPVGILLDIEMPRMDGYELMAALRNQPMYQHIPLIVLTSRAATKHQQRALQLGADAYVIKPYQDDQLLTTVGELVPVKANGEPK
jgi:chemotaxis protein histidine kinase CheA/ActR/RegA family two-component response regulator